MRDSMLITSLPEPLYSSQLNIAYQGEHRHVNSYSGLLPFAIIGTDELMNGPPIHLQPDCFADSVMTPRRSFCCR
ncbi:hypothetical protein BN77_3234 [Rhizobium mesoamericanum STM3625]|uniref:Uncharacterized protein n=1 Tax=Rhizobium mesoamericanum STM3625 TaxID=1211777 RepID=K0Q0Z1_9HYPH|nr:hypothetical protein BN77_3234 [Rhizobium mesoamericanum STM3625]